MALRSADTARPAAKEAAKAARLPFAVVIVLGAFLMRCASPHVGGMRGSACVSKTRALTSHFLECQTRTQRSRCFNTPLKASSLKQINYGMALHGNQVIGAAILLAEAREYMCSTVAHGVMLKGDTVMRRQGMDKGNSSAHSINS